MAGGIDWFRWHHGSVTDPKFQLVARKAGARLGDVITVWAFVLEKASADADRGTIGELDFETIDFLLGAEDGTTVRILDAMTARGLIEGSRIAAWEKRQPKREREDDTAAERKRQQRAREAEESNVTPCHTTSHQETPREEKSREEEKKEPRSKAESAPATRLPADWEPPAEFVEFCQTERPDLDPQAVGDRFRDHWLAQPGKDGRKADWFATWRNWVRRERVMQPARASPPAGRPEKFDPVAHVNRNRITQ